MARRQISPIRAPIRSQMDPRDNMIRKLKEDLIVARGRQKQLAILQHYLVQLIEKTKLLTAQMAKSDQQGKLKLELTIKSINQLKKEVDILRAQLRSITNQLGVVEEEEIDLKKILNSKLIEIQKLKKEGISLHEDNEKLLNQHYRLRSQEDETVHEIKKLSETIRNYESRLSQINRKILQVKAYINEISEQNLHLRDKLKGYERQNQGMDNDLDQKENRIDLLQRNFAENHQIIKNQVQNYIELEHQNEKNLKQTKHKANLVKIENQKSNELSTVIKKLQKNISDRSKDLSQVLGDSNEINKINEDFVRQNTRLKQDLLYCQDHLQNLMKHNAFIQQQMQNYLREDEAIINIIRRKKLLPITNNYTSLRTSRNQAKIINRTYL